MLKGLKNIYDWYLILTFPRAIFFKVHAHYRHQLVFFWRFSRPRGVRIMHQCALYNPKYGRFLLHASFYHVESVCFKSVIQSGRSLFLSKIKNTSLKLPVGVSPLQLVNSHRNRRYFVIKLHTWFCLSYFLKTNIKFYCIYQYFMSINSFFNTVSVSRYSRPITVTRDPH
jgi:hypothetical protein